MGCCDDLRPCIGVYALLDLNALVLSKGPSTNCQRSNSDADRMQDGVLSRSRAVDGCADGRFLLRAVWRPSVDQLHNASFNFASLRVRINRIRRLELMYRKSKAWSRSMFFHFWLRTDGPCKGRCVQCGFSARSYGLSQRWSTRI